MFVCVFGNETKNKSLWSVLLQACHYMQCQIKCLAWLRLGDLHPLPDDPLLFEMQAVVQIAILVHVCVCVCMERTNLYSYCYNYFILLVFSLVLHIHLLPCLKHNCQCSGRCDECGLGMRRGARGLVQSPSLVPRPHPLTRRNSLVNQVGLAPEGVGHCMLPYIRDQILELVNESLLVAVL